MKKTMFIVIAAALLGGCAGPQKMRDVELKGMYVNGYSEVLAIGSGKLTSIPGDREALAAHYEEDTAWLRPSIKTHKVDVFLVGSNSVVNADGIISAICKAFTEVAPGVAAADAEAAKSGSTSPLDVVKSGGEIRKEVKLAKTAAGTAQTTAADPHAEGCADGRCGE